MVDRVIETDVLVVGAGGGGLRAAVEAHAAGARVLLLSKGIVGKSGLTQTAVTGFQVAYGYADPRDNPDVHYLDTMRGSYGLADPALVRIFTREVLDAVADIERFGGHFDRDESGKLIQRKLDASQTYARSIKKGDSLGTPIMQALRREMNKREIPRMHEMLITRLMKDGDRVSGAVALDFRTGDLVAIRARSVILATGGAGELFPVNSNTPDSTGDGYALALDAGADLVDMEFILMLGHAVLHPQAVRGVLYTFQYLLPKGAAPLYNAEGEPFLARYDPEGSDNPARHIYARAIYGEVRAGRGTPHGGAWFDPSSVSMETLHETLPSQTQYLLNFGVDMRKPIEVGVAAHYVCGGVRIGPNAETSLRGLYAVGECSGGVHGAARIGGNSLSELLVFGKRAGRHAAEYAATADAVRSDAEAEDAEYRRVLGLLDRGRDGPRPTEVKQRLQATMDRDVGVVRNDQGLGEAIATLEALEAGTLPTMAVASEDRIGNYDWVEALEVSSMVRLGRAIAGAARLRTESRGAHYREDRPNPDDAWRKNILISSDGGEISFRTRPAAPEHLDLEKVA